MPGGDQNIERLTVYPHLGCYKYRMREMGTSSESHDPFADVQRLLEQGKSKQAVNWLLDSRTGRIKNRFRSNLNRAWYLVGSGYYHMGRLKKASDAFRRALKYWRDDIEALIAMGHCYDEMEKPKIAERYLRRALVIDKDRDDVLYNLGNALFDQGRFFEAATVYKRVSNGADETYLRARRNYQMAIGRSVRS
jgi:tetratricopeptide (TPR) repeat protein